MTIATLTLWFLSVTGPLLGMCALLVASRSSDRTLRKRLNELSERFSEVELALETLTGKVRSMRVSIHNRERAKPDESAPKLPMTEADKDAWQRKMNLELARKRFGV